jgi:three-Cys-motif partner protein
MVLRSLFDRIGAWTKLKHEIVQYYAETYSNILTRSRGAIPLFKHFYIDGFASAGLSIDKSSGKLVRGSALRILDVKPPFAKYFLVELDPKRCSVLQRLCSDRSDVLTFCGDANVILPQRVFREVRREKYERAFCLLDPYNETNLHWKTVVAAAKTEAIDVLIHFPIYSMNINVLRKSGPAQKQRLNVYWGDGSWEPIAYEPDPQMDLFGGARTTKVEGQKLIAAYRERLMSVAGFKGTSQPIPMRNSKGNIVYYLIFATSNKPTGAKAINAVANHFIKRTEE